MLNIFVILALLLFSSFTGAMASTDKFGYSGRLVQDNGMPVTGSVNLQFDLSYSSNAGTSQASATVNGVTLADGVFTVELDFPGFESVLDGKPSTDDLLIRVTNITDPDSTKHVAYDYQSVYSTPISKVAGKALDVADSTISFGKLNIDGGCADSEVLSYDGTNLVCVQNGEGTVSSVTAGSGISITGTTTPTINTVVDDTTVEVDGVTNELKIKGGTNGSVLTTNGDGEATWTSALCLGTEFVRGFDTNGDVICAPDSDTTLEAGNGIDGTSLTAGTIDLNLAASSGLIFTGTPSALDTDPTVLQTRVTEVCPAGEALILINADGSATCAPFGDFESDGSIPMSGDLDMNGNRLTNAASIQIKDGDTNYVEIKTPANLGGDYVLTLPPDAGTSGYLLTTDGSGALTWSAPNTTNGDITAVTAGTGLTGGGPDGDVTLNVDVGTTAGKIVQMDGTGKLPAIDGSQLTNIPNPTTSTTLDGFAPGADSTITNTDTVETAFEKAQGQINGNNTDIAANSTAISNNTTAIGALDTDDVPEGTNLYYTTTRARTDAVLNSTAGDQIDQAPSVDAMKTYVLAETGAINESQWTTSGSDIFYNSGNVGIGTTTPSYKLAVEGVAGSPLGGNGFPIYDDATQAGFYCSLNSLGTYISHTSGTTTGNRDYWNGSNWIINAGGAIATSVTCSESKGLMASGKIYFDGDVGIGTETPATKLSVDIQTTDSVAGPTLNSYPMSRFINTGSGGGQRGLEIGAPTGGLTSPVYMKVSGTSNRFSLLNNLDEEQLTVLGGGNVGIGTSAPASQLEIETALATKPALRLKAASAQSSNIFEIKDNANTNLLSVDNLGFMTLPGDPTANLHAATKQYVDNQTEGAVTAGTTGQYYRGDKSWQTLDTAVVPENTNLYFTDARARAALSGTAPLSYDPATGAISIDGLSTMGAANQLFGVNGTGSAAEYKTLNGTANQVGIAHGANSITLSTPQDIHSGATPTFGGMSLTGVLDMGTNKITNLANPTLAQDAVTKSYVDTLSPGYAFVQGGNSYGVLATLGTNDAQSLAIETSGVERLRVGATGNIGIGTSLPLSDLHLQSSSPAPVTIERTTDANSSIQYKNSTSAMYAGLSQYDTFSIGPGENLGTNGILHVTSAGSVGIGTTTPSSKLEVNGSLLLGPNSSWGQKFRVGIDTSLATVPEATIGATNGNLHIEPRDTYHTYINHYTDPTSNVYMATSGGKVGIGTISPSSTLHISSDSTSNTGINITNSDTGGNTYTLMSTGSSAPHGAGAFSIYDKNRTQHDLVVKAGNVGIGTTTPLANFHLDSPSGARMGIVEDSGATSVTDANPYFEFKGFNTNMGYVGYGSTTTDDLYLLNRLPNGRINFGTNDTPGKLVIDQNGNVGIGTTAPTSKLVLSNGYDGGTTWPKDTISLGLSSDFSREGITIVNTSDSAFFGLESRGAYENDYDTVLEFGDDSADSFHLKFDSTTLLTALATGNIGIGTQSPSEKLEVVGDVKANNFQGKLNGLKMAAGSFTFSDGSCGDTVGAPCNINISGGGFSVTPACTLTMRNSDATTYTEKMVVKTISTTNLSIWRGNYKDSGTTISGYYTCIGG